MDKNYPAGNAITALRVFAIAGVVLYHCNFTHPIIEENLATDIVHFFTVDLGMVFNPFFFFLSGLLFFRGIEGNMRRKLRSRLTTLLLPYLCWNVLAYALVLIKRYVFTGAYPQYLGADLAFPAMLKGLWALSFIGLDSQMPYDFVLWFVRDLLVVVPAACLLYHALGLRAWIVAPLAAAFALSRHADTYGLVYAFCFFYSGGLMEKLLRRDGLRRAMRSSVALQGALLTGMPVFLCRYSLYHLLPSAAPDWLDYPLTLWCIGAFFVAAELMCRRRRGNLADSVTARALFFIYAAHGLWVNAAARFVFSHLPDYGNLSVLTGYVLLFLTMWYADLLAFRVIDRVAPRLTAVMCGSRSRPKTAPVA